MPNRTTQNQDTSRSQNQGSSSRSASSDDNRTHGKQGFASMPKEKVREIAAEGGRHSHDNDNKKQILKILTLR